MALSASAKDYLSRFFPGPPSPLWETDPEFMELFANFAPDQHDAPGVQDIDQ